MNYLLDTHAFIWFLNGDESLSATVRELIEDPANIIFLSTASVWEMSIKVSLGKLILSQPFELLVREQLILNNIAIMDISLNHTFLVATLPFHHRDPFDRLIAAQSLISGVPLLSVDSMFDGYGVHRIW